MEEGRGREEGRGGRHGLLAAVVVVEAYEKQYFEFHSDLQYCRSSLLNQHRMIYHKYYLAYK